MSMTTTSSGGSSLGAFDIRNEKVQKLLGWLALGGIGFAFYAWALPYIYTIAVLSLKTAIVCAAIAVMALFVVNGRLRWALGYMVQRTIDLFVSLIINSDPIGVMKNYLVQVKKQVGILNARIADIRGAVEKAKRDLTVNESESEEAEQTIAGAKKRGDTTSPAVRLATNMILRREKTIARIKSDIAQGNAIVTLLTRYRDQANAYEADMEDTIMTTERERNRLKTTTAAFRAAMSILKGGSIGADMYHDALDKANEQAAAMIGEIQQFIDESHGALDGFEMQQEGAVQQVLARLEQKEQGSKLLQYTPGTTLPDASQATSAEPVPAGMDLSRFLSSHN